MAVRILKKIIAVLSAAVLAFLLALPFHARAEQSVVRVLLSRLALTDQATVSLDGSYTLNDLSFQRGSKITFAIASGSIMAYYEGMAAELGKEAVLRRHAAPEDQENGLRVNGGYALYCGDLHLFVQDGALTAVLHIPVEEYLLGVVPYEMSDSFPLEALKAQAVAARTYALRKVGNNANYDLVDNTNDQVYRGYQKENENAIRAVRETEGICGYARNVLANCYYTASNGGQVELPAHVWAKAEGDYITMHADPYDLENPESVVKKASFPKKTQDGILGNADFTEAIVLQLSEPLTAQGYSGEAEDIRITGVEAMEVHTPLDSPDSLVMSRLRLTLQVEGRREIPAETEEEMSIFQLPQITGKPSESPAPTGTPAPAVFSDFERLPDAVTVDVPIFTVAEPLLGLDINSTNNEIYTVEEEKTGFSLCARRYGHGVGLSQRGAQWMAQQYGWNYEQILRFYYPGMELRTRNTQVTLPPALSAKYLTTPGPAATLTPRPTLMPVTQALQAGESLVAVTGIGVNSSLNLRSAPSTDGEILRLLYYGQELIVTQNVGDGWLQVKTDAVEGYVMEKFVEEKK